MLKVLQSGGPRTTPSGYPGGPIVPSGQLSPQHSTATTSQMLHQQPQMLRSVSQHPTPQQSSQGYSTTGRMSVHQQLAAGAPTTHQQQHGQQGPVSFTRALEMTENIAKEGQLIHNAQGGQVQNANKPQTATSSGEGGAQDNQKRDSVYDVNNYEISV